MGYAYVLGCILTSTLLLVWLRLLRLPIFTLITANYFLAALAALLYKPLSWEGLLQTPLSGRIGLMILGILFVLVFSLTGRVSREVGVGLAGMLSKLSLVIPISFSVLILKEPISNRQVIGLILALLAIFLVHAPYLQEGGLKRLWQALRWGILLWVGNGVIDTLFKAFQPSWKSLPDENIPLLIMSVAGLTGLALHITQKQLSQFRHISLWRGALLLGLTNIASVIFYVKGLRVLPTVPFFLSLNLGIVLLSGTLGVVLFKERFSWMVGLGYAAGLGAIALLVG
jgi:drug/metabolite transporter (DMT)-like permease